MENNSIPVAAPYIKDFEQLAFGMFVHFGLYSQLNKGEWVYHIHGLEMDSYRQLKNSFRVGSMQEIVNTAKSAGCKYITLTTRHHEGFSLYDTRGLTDFDIMHTPTGRDLVREFVDTCREADIVPFFYHTTLDWYNKDFKGDFDTYLDYLYKSVEILCTNYGKIGGLWFDGNWSNKEADWKEERLYKMIHSYQPDAMIINNTGLGARGKIGLDEIDAVTYERGMPKPLDLRGRSKYISGEMCETLCDHWGAADDINFKPIKRLIEELCECRKVGANFLLNIGPSGDGSVSKMQQAIMECIGHWMRIYGKAIYNGRPYILYDDKREFLLRDVNDSKTAYLFKFNPNQADGDENVSLELDGKKALVLENIPETVSAVTWMDNNENLNFKQEGNRVLINCTGYPYGQSLCVRVAQIQFQ